MPTALAHFLSEMLPPGSAVHLEVIIGSASEQTCHMGKLSFSHYEGERVSFK